MDKYHILNFHEIFAENAYCLSLRLGIKLDKEFKPEQGHTYIIFGAHNQAATLHAVQLSNPYFKYIIINAEPPQSDNLRNKFYISLMKSNIVWDYHPKSAEYLKTLDIRVYGQYLFEFPEIKSSAERDIDILFVGSKNDRRENVEKRLAERYSNKNIEFHFDWKHSNQQDLTKLLHRAKAVINIPFHESGILESHRINKALACGCKVVSLKSGHKPTDDFYEKYCFMVHDLFQYFDQLDMCPNSLEQKLPYSNLITNFHGSIVHAKWILEQLSKN